MFYNPIHIFQFMANRLPSLLEPFLITIKIKFQYQ